MSIMPFDEEYTIIEIHDEEPAGNDTKDNKGVYNTGYEEIIL